MNVREAINLFDQSRKRVLLIGDESAGVLVGLDVEGRLWTVRDGVVLNRLNPQAITGQCTREAYLNPGGDGLWPAPEGSRLGYEYATGLWRVPPGLTGARFVVAEAAANRVRVQAEIDLINASGLGVPTRFARDVRVSREAGVIEVTVTESIEFLGALDQSRAVCLIAPWTLCQFDSCEGCEVVFPDGGESCVWDLYAPSDAWCRREGGLWRTRTEPAAGRYQIGIGPTVDWIEFRNPQNGLTVRRAAERLPAGQNYIDIADRPPSEPPTDRGIRFSVYNDPSGFMEIEAAGGCTDVLRPGTCLATTVTTRYS